MRMSNLDKQIRTLEQTLNNLTEKYVIQELTECQSTLVRYGTQPDSISHILEMAYKQEPLAEIRKELIQEIHFAHKDAKNY